MGCRFERLRHTFGSDMTHKGLSKTVLRREAALLAALDVKDRLRKLFRSEVNLKRFGGSFYFVRYNFYRHNFLVGARSSPNEVYWGGLVGNLREELGGNSQLTHNSLYRNFLAEIGIENELVLKQPRFARTFNESWHHYITTQPFLHALGAIAVYELLDQPDYSLLLTLVKEAGISRRGLRFFSVHAQANHYELFQGPLTEVWKSKRGQLALTKAARFVNEMQETMWRGLLHHLEKYN